MKYLGLYADSDGESHFEDIGIESNPVDFAPLCSNENELFHIHSLRLRNCENRFQCTSPFVNNPIVAAGALS